ncbi:MAG: winged helix-turn-helix transcriptional regulator [Mojavia pulchra JT2-VF2]|jgi:hypothetical protein|uniref:Winged helix-turn-helix transcriptional regulator n=1 Tax=Mojavia pulchra JT2-VF2 TaxID=287848 RepID=A0A951Q2V4_9NOST|nr:winged helix-turn-helix transcriptional regulator [Mojavia pulchra JT2-VF2]
MARSLRVAPEYIKKVKSALLRNGYPSQQSLADAVGISLSTVKNCTVMMILLKLLCLWKIGNLIINNLI